mmetsp:Transcript_32344/g.32967  ORF Transcript_32344/g.32967 Transcript_32344/m.32967 type:complete len:261 (+) Transcript_32344:108-890(+)|eukprot:CAMPEP_0182416108 /NCGR_PEP_ID=MMETSP1167-20130531/209_1 /TAXON_ID=2988 /ORGANISM="Mallomonas Sp, Strain CCMP3275" /LENGTH=260 /DNA_ID=CAMNT_0024588537 /DNA_START=60 /DNA_END=842 /DNA_ORIENTATION=-
MNSISMRRVVNPRFTNSTLAVRAYSSSNVAMQDWANRPGVWDEKDLGSMISANRTWMSKMQKENPDYFEMNKAGHFPKILWIGCVDARVPANELINEPPGSVFVHRNIANQVVNTDSNCMSVLQYAVDYLKVKHVVVCGHYDCGGCKAAMSNYDHQSPLENWLRNIRDTFRIHKDEILAIKDITARQNRLVELNVAEQCINLFKTVQVQRAQKESKEAGKPFEEPQIHGYCFDPHTGELKKLQVDFSKAAEELKTIYSLY